MPLFTVFSATPQIGDDVHATLVQPNPPSDAQEVGTQANAVAAKAGGICAVQLRPLPSYYIDGHGFRL